MTSPNSPIISNLITTSTNSNNNNNFQSIPLNLSYSDSSSISSNSEPSSTRSSITSTTSNDSNTSMSSTDSNNKITSSVMLISPPKKPKVTEYGTKTPSGHSRIFNCKICQRAFTREEHLTRHVQSTHNKLKPFTCGICSRPFSRRDLLLRHAKNLHKGSEKAISRIRRTYKQNKNRNNNNENVNNEQEQDHEDEHEDEKDNDSNNSNDDEDNELLEDEKEYKRIVNHRINNIQLPPIRTVPTNNNINSVKSINSNNNNSITLENDRPIKRNKSHESLQSKRLKMSVNMLVS
ncbi:hypothetical protein KGF54_003430 [Candida jiufengensis]|uniref:uncharacterized protein n=1 Tax=Candida jiufengensis TaxID=497108 RepID=UPI00222512DB|nr:uncharacterized protein KGF54_003430 [Candida jiufengensis]KAI5952563.1 hypothetical protein KGF54_003430 [Candida jiufengensis]